MKNAELKLGKVYEIVDGGDWDKSWVGYKVVKLENAEGGYSFYNLTDDNRCNTDFSSSKFKEVKVKEESKDAYKKLINEFKAIIKKEKKIMALQEELKAQRKNTTKLVQDVINAEAIMEEFDAKKLTQLISTNSILGFRGLVSSDNSEVTFRQYFFKFLSGNQAYQYVDNKVRNYNVNFDKSVLNKLQKKYNFTVEFDSKEFSIEDSNLYTNESICCFAYYNLVFKLNGQSLNEFAEMYTKVVAELKANLVVS